MIVMIISVVDRTDSASRLSWSWYHYCYCCYYYYYWCMYRQCCNGKDNLPMKTKDLLFPLYNGEADVSEGSSNE